MLGWVGLPHDLFNHQLYCWDCPQVGRLVIIPWARGAAVWHKNEAIRFTCRENTWLLPDGLAQWFSWRSLRTNISRHREHKGLEIALLLSHPGCITGNLTNVQASWGSQHCFLKGACLVHGTFEVVEKFMKCAVLDSFFQEGFESILFQESAFSYSLEYVISWCLYLYLSHNHFTASVSIGYCEAPHEVIVRSPMGYCLLHGAHQFGCRIATAGVTFCSYELKKYKQGTLKWWNNTI